MKYEKKTQIVQQSDVRHRMQVIIINSWIRQSQLQQKSDKLIAKDPHNISRRMHKKTSSASDFDVFGS